MTAKQIYFSIAVLAVLLLGLAWLVNSSEPAIQEDPTPKEHEVHRTAEEEQMHEAPTRMAADRRKQDVPTQATPEDMLWLRGTVLANGRNPIPNASVELLRPWQLSYASLDLEKNRKPASLKKLLTSADGRFEFRVLRGQAHELRVEAHGFGHAVTRECYGGQDLEISLLPAGCTLMGRATWKNTGAPIAGIKLRGFRAGGPTLFEGKTGGDGSYRFDAVPTGSFYFSVVPEVGRQPSWSNLTLTPGQVTTHDIQIERGFLVSGRVLDAVTKRPIPNAEVGQDWTFTRSTRTDADGRYEAQGWTSRGIQEIHARAAGFGRIGKSVGDAKDGNIVVDFELMPGGRVSGRVLSPEGSPLAGVYVAAVASQRVGRQQHTDWKASKTAADGSFRLNSLRTDVPHALLVRKSGFATLVYDFPRLVRAGEVLKLGDVTLQLPACLEGRVVDKNDAGVARVEVSLRGWNKDRGHWLSAKTEERNPRTGLRQVRPGGNYVASRTATTDHEGLFRFADLAAGSWEIRADVRGAPRMPPTRVQLEAGRVRRDVRLRIDVSLSVSGRVRAWDGQAIRSRVTLIPSDRRLGAQQLSRLVEAGQRFEFKGVRPGAYTLRAYQLFSDDSSLSFGSVEGRVQVAIPAPGEVLIVLPNTAFIEGVLLDANGEATAGLIVAAYAAEDGKARMIGHMKTKQGGRFRLRIAAGTSVTLKGGPPPSMSNPFPFIALPDPRRAAVASNVQAGTSGLVLRSK